jgi:OCT family organic cation transporter-like MFS transporter 4/5
MSSLKTDNNTEIKKNKYSKCSFFIPYASKSKLEKNSQVVNMLDKTLETRSFSLDDNKNKTILISDDSTSSNSNSTRMTTLSSNNNSLKKSKRNPPTNLDDILGLVGSFGLYQQIQFVLVGFLAIIPSMVAYSYVFVSATPRFTCKTVLETQIINTDSSKLKLNKLKSNQYDYQDESGEDPFKYLKAEKSEYLIETRRFISLISSKNDSIIFDNNCKIEPNKIFSSQYAKVNNKTQKNEFQNLKCIEWIYDDSVYGSTTVTDWNLVCLKSHLKALTQNAFILGTGCSVFTGILSDKYGRRTALILMVTLMVLVLNTTQYLMHLAVLSNETKFIIFTISRFIQGVAQTMYSISFVLLLELVGPKHRVTAGNILAYSFSVGQMILAGLAYFLKNWLKIQWTLAVYVIPFFMYYWMVPESPRWLLSMSKVRRARHYIEKMFKVNSKFKKFRKRYFKCCFTSKDVNDSQSESEALDNLLTVLQEEARKFSTLKKNTSYSRTWHGILKSPILLRRFFILIYTWMVMLAVYLGIGMGISGNLDKIMDPYLVFFVAAVCEFFSIVTCHLSLNRFGRKFPLVTFLIINSISIYLIPIYFDSKHTWVAVFFYFLAKYSIGAVQLTLMIFTSELCPTPMRSTGVGLCFALARLGGVWAPQINVLSSTLNSVRIPFIIFSIMSLLAGVLCFLLPETLNKQLPENLSQAKALRK